jgi:hypothetical protein
MDIPKVSDSNANFLRSNLDKFILIAAVATMMAFTHHASHHDMDNQSGVTQFDMNLAGQAFAALLTLLTIGSKKNPPGSSDASDVSDAGGKVKQVVHRTVETTTEIPATPEDPATKE